MNTDRLFPAIPLSGFTPDDFKAPDQPLRDVVGGVFYDRCKKLNPFECIQSDECAYMGAGICEMQPDGEMSHYQSGRMAYHSIYAGMPRPSITDLSNSPSNMVPHDMDKIYIKKRSSSKKKKSSKGKKKR